MYTYQIFCAIHGNRESNINKCLKNKFSRVCRHINKCMSWTGMVMVVIRYHMAWLCQVRAYVKDQIKTKSQRMLVGTLILQRN
jgi:hypothetical protein